jgi:ribosome recycling factor
MFFYFLYISILLQFIHMNYNFSETKTTLQEIQDWLKKEFSHISTGRANPALLDSVIVESYGTRQPVKNIASITMEDARTLRVAPWDKGQIKDIERAIADSKLPVTVSSGDQGLRVAVPQLTEESKKVIVKLVKEKLEEARVKVRAERNRVEKDIEAKKKEGDMGEDEMFSAKADLQKEIDNANKHLEEITQNKEEDVMKV